MAGIMQNDFQQKGHVFKPSNKQLKRLMNTMRKYEKQRNDIEQLNSNSSTYRPSGNSFRDSLSVNNPNGQYYQPNYNSNVRISNTRIQGDNVKIGQIDNDNERY